MANYFCFDGHDGTGKTSTALKLCDENPSVYYLRPYKDVLGDFLAYLGRMGKSELLAKTAIQAVEFAKEQVNYSDDSIVIFDRCWLSMFTLIDERYWQEWDFKPKTIHFTCSLDDVVSRIEARGEKIGTISNHNYYLGLFSRLAKKFELLTIDTSVNSEDLCIEIARNAVYGKT